jgi:hypothetical protein
MAVLQRPAAPAPTPPPERTAPAAETLAPPDQPAVAAEEAPVNIVAPPVEQPTPVEAPADFPATPKIAIAANDADINDRIASDNAAAAVLEQVESVGEDVLQGIKARDRTLFVLLTSSGGVKPIDIKDDMIVFEVKNDWQVKRIEQNAPRRVIEGVLSKCMGTNYRISCVAEAQNRENPNVRREQIRDSRKDLHVKAAINIFDADIIDVEHNQ